MTREQLINKVISAVPLDDISIAKDAVDEYVEQECVKFASWIGKNMDIESIHGKHYSEIYQLYKNKDNQP